MAPCLAFYPYKYRKDSQHNLKAKMELLILCAFFDALLLAVSRKVRNFGTPNSKLGYVPQQCLDGFRVQVHSGNRAVLGILHEAGRHQTEIGIWVGKDSN